ncbi:MAG: hypothetical protein ACFCD0_06070 [Gemmataceae bacterium]
MNHQIPTITTYSALEKHVLQMLCDHDDLEPTTTPIHRRTLWKATEPCGFFFHVRGPRLLKAYAVWTLDENRILFYDGMGNRFAETKLSGEAPIPDDITGTPTPASMAGPSSH